MDLGTIIGFVSGSIFIVISMLLPVNFDISAVVSSFVDPASIMITIGGTLAATVIGSPLSKIKDALKGARYILFPPKVDAMESIQKIIELSILARKEGVLALDEIANTMEDPFLKKGITLIVDATDPELVRSILETEMSYIEERHRNAQGVWEFIGSQAPSWGMIGTLIGLIMMLRNLEDTASIGPNMSIALITTFYGSIMANFVANPIANKMKTYSEDELLVKLLQIEGMLSIQAGENPRIIEEKLKSFLSPALRKNSADETKAGA